MLPKYDFTEEQIEVKDISDTHKIFLYNGNIFIADYDKEHDKWENQIFTRLGKNETDGANSLYTLIAWAIRSVDDDGVFSPNYVTEITQSNFKIKELGLEY